MQCELCAAGAQEGAVYRVRVVRLMDYGAFVELPNGFQALLHISELAHHRVREAPRCWTCALACACRLLARMCIFQENPSTVSQTASGHVRRCECCVGVAWEAHLQLALSAAI